MRALLIGGSAAFGDPHRQLSPGVGGSEHERRLGVGDGVEISRLPRTLGHLIGGWLVSCWLVADWVGRFGACAGNATQVRIRPSPRPEPVDDGPGRGRREDLRAVRALLLVVPGLLGPRSRLVRLSGCAIRLGHRPMIGDGDVCGVGAVAATLRQLAPLHRQGTDSGRLVVEREPGSWVHAGVRDEVDRSRPVGPSQQVVEGHRLGTGSAGLGDDAVEVLASLSECLPALPSAGRQVIHGPAEESDGALSREPLGGCLGVEISESASRLVGPRQLDGPDLCRKLPVLVAQGLVDVTGVGGGLHRPLRVPAGLRNLPGTLSDDGCRFECLEVRLAGDLDDVTGPDVGELTQNRFCLVVAVEGFARRPRFGESFSRCLDDVVGNTGQRGA